jgi:hypothetical protein
MALSNLETHQGRAGMMEGLNLLRILIEATGLPPDAVERELTRIINRRGLSPETISIDDVREVMCTYLQDVLVGAKDAHELER